MFAVSCRFFQQLVCDVLAFCTALFVSADPLCAHTLICDYRKGITPEPDPMVAIRGDLDARVEFSY